jgi:hypothetical protein
MATNRIIRESDPEVKPPRIIHICIDHELADLALELFSTTYGMSWQQAFDAARSMLADLMIYGLDWDEAAWQAAVSDEVQQ